MAANQAQAAPSFPLPPKPQLEANPQTQAHLPPPPPPPADSRPPKNDPPSPRNNHNPLPDHLIGKKIFIAGLPDDTRIDDLEDCFGRLGRVTNVELKRNFGFVEFESAAAASEAVAKYDQGSFLGVIIKVELSHGKGPRKGDDKGICYICGSAAHWAKACPEHDGRPSRRGEPRDPPPRDRYDDGPDYPRRGPPPPDFYSPPSFADRIGGPAPPSLYSSSSGRPDLGPLSRSAPPYPPTSTGKDYYGGRSPYSSSGYGRNGPPPREPLSPYGDRRAPLPPYYGGPPPPASAGPPGYPYSAPPTYDDRYGYAPPPPGRYDFAGPPPPDPYYRSGPPPPVAPYYPPYGDPYARDGPGPMSRGRSPPPSGLRPPRDGYDPNMRYDDRRGSGGPPPPLRRRSMSPPARRIIGLGEPGPPPPRERRYPPRP